jgi:hypothetical protein
MRELGITAADLADKAEVSYGTVKYLGFLTRNPETLEHLSAALDWPPNHLPDLWGGEQLN